MIFRQLISLYVSTSSTIDITIEGEIVDVKCQFIASSHINLEMRFRVSSRLLPKPVANGAARAPRSLCGLEDCRKY